MLRARLERRRKRQAGRGKAQLKQEERAAEASVKAQIDAALADKVQTAEREAQDELREAKAGTQSGNPIAKAMLTKLREALAAQAAELQTQAEKERKDRVRAAHEDIHHKHGQGVQTNEELDQELAAVMQAGGSDENQDDGQAKLEAAKATRKRTIEERKRRLKEEQAEFTKKLKEDYERAEQELQGIDLVLQEAAEKRRVEALKQNGLFDDREKAKEAAKLKDRTHRVQQEADAATEGTALVDQLRQQGLDAEAALRVEQDQQAARLAARRELLK